MLRSTLGAAMVAALAVGGTLGTSPAAFAKNNNTGAVIGGLVAGAVIGAAVAGSAKQPDTIYVNPRPPPPPPGPNPWKNAFSPKPGVTCYPVQHACYNANGAYNANWTWKVYQR
ncbi:MAG: hypothetical protein J0H08_06220 [Rhizobiales bacterium]|nr:hypothetical protein [Hyphomicrobiales bacterium]